MGLFPLKFSVLIHNMENFANVNFLKEIRLAKITMYLSKSPFDDLGSDSLARLTGRRPIFTIMHFKETVKGHLIWAF